MVYPIKAQSNSHNSNAQSCVCTYTSRVFVPLAVCSMFYLSAGVLHSTHPSDPSYLSSLICIVHWFFAEKEVMLCILINLSSSLPVRPIYSSVCSWLPHCRICFQSPRWPRYQTSHCIPLHHARTVCYSNAILSAGMYLCMRLLTFLLLIVILFLLCCSLLSYLPLVHKLLLMQQYNQIQVWNLLNRW